MFYNIRMPNAKTVCITIPPELLKKAQKLAAREHRTMSELFREALRRYMAGGGTDSTSSGSTASEAVEPASDGTGVLHSFRMEKK